MTYLIIALTLSFIAIVYLYAKQKRIADQLKMADKTYKEMAKEYNKFKNNNYISYRGLNDPDKE